MSQLATILETINGPKAAVAFLIAVALVFTFWALTLPNGAGKTFAACYSTKMGFAKGPEHPSVTGGPWDVYSKEEAAFIEKTAICIDALEELASIADPICSVIDSLCPTPPKTEPTTISQGK